MRRLALIGLGLSLLLACAAVLDTLEAVQRARAAQGRALAAAMSSTFGRETGSVRQMDTAAAQMFVNPAVRALLRPGRGAPARQDRAYAAAALDSFEQQALIGVAGACIDDAAGRPIVCGAGSRRAEAPPALAARFAQMAAAAAEGVITPSFPTAAGRITGAYLVALRAGGRVLGIAQFDMTGTKVSGSSLIARDIPGVRIALAVYAGAHLLRGGAVAPPLAELGSTRWQRWGTWQGVRLDHRTMVAVLPVRLGVPGLHLAAVASAAAPDPNFLRALNPGRMALLVLALAALSACAAGLLVSGRRLRRELSTDPLTGLLNRRALMEDLPRACARASEEHPALLWFFDLNGFKGYNDAFGHPAGDALLTRLGQQLRGAVGRHGTVYRLGGDEFCALVTAPPSDPLALFERARESLAERGGAFTVTASAGAVEVPREAGEPTRAMRLADQHMYRDKAVSRPGAAELVTAVLHAALAQRHPELDEHSSDVACDVEMLARAVGLDEDAVAMVIRAGDLHDVGKLGIPDEIINRPGPLTEHEWEFMRQHTVMGERIIAAAGPSLERIAPLVRASHERWDGLGYPDGLAGEQIPLGARIITICDSFQAMLSERPYKRPMPLEEALAELRRCAGSQFDPALVELYCSLIARRAAHEHAPRPSA